MSRNSKTNNHLGAFKQNLQKERDSNYLIFIKKLVYCNCIELIRKKMLKKEKYVIFCLDKQKFALHLSDVERVVRIVEITPLSKVPEYILGAINLHGEFLPVVNLRILFNLNEREINLNDQLIITNTATKKVALWVNLVSDIIELEKKEILDSDKIMMDSEYVEGVFKYNDEIVVIHDLDTFLKVNKKVILKTTNKKKMTKAN